MRSEELKQNVTVYGPLFPEPIGVDGGKWPTQEDRLVQFSWEPRNLSWQVTGTSEVDQKF